MPTNFLSLPRELRDQIYAYVLVDEEHIEPSTWIIASYRPQILLTNKMIHAEATEIFYTHNCFAFTGHSGDDLVDSFFARIGRENSKYIRHVRINFPMFKYLDPSDVSLTEKSVGVLEKLRDCCGNLRTLTTSRYSTYDTERRLDIFEHPEIIAEAIKHVDTHFQAISSAQKKSSSSLDHDSICGVLSIIVEIYANSFDGDTKKGMESHGWILDVAEEIEEVLYGSDRSYGSHENIRWRSES